MAVTYVFESKESLVSFVESKAIEARSMENRTAVKRDQLVHRIAAATYENMAEILKHSRFEFKPE